MFSRISLGHILNNSLKSVMWCLFGKELEAVDSSPVRWSPPPLASPSAAPVEDAPPLPSFESSFPGVKPAPPPSCEPQPTAASTSTAASSSSSQDSLTSLTVQQLNDMRHGFIERWERLYPYRVVITTTRERRTVSVRLLFCNPPAFNIALTITYKTTQG